MIIALKLTAAQLAYLDTFFESYCEETKIKFGTLSKEEKTTFSIAQDVADKLHTKARTANRSAKKKEYKVSFKYHEAHAINHFISYDVSNDDQYISSVAQNIYSQLDPKL